MQRFNAKKALYNMNAYVMLLCLILFSIILTYLIPSGTFQRSLNETTGIMSVEVNSFQYIEKPDMSLMSMLTAVPRGLVSSATIIFFIFIVSGTIQIARGTGALDVGVRSLVKNFNSRGTLALCVISVSMAILGAVFGFAQQLIPIIPLGVVLAEGLGYDRVTGFHIIKTSSWVGFAAAVFSPPTVGIAQELAGLPIYSGWPYRVLCFVVFMTIYMIFMLRYANKVKNDPSKSILAGYQSTNAAPLYQMPENDSLTKRQTAVLLLLCVMVVLMVYGSMKLEWKTTELSGLFMVFGIIMGFVGGMTPNRIAKEFTKGLSGIAFGAIVVGFSRAIVLIFEDGCVLDTIIYFFTNCISNIGTVGASVVVVLIHSVINFFIGSGSGQAAATLPIMLPLGDLLGLTRQTSVLAFQFGDGITNMMWPAMVYYLVFADIPYDRWVKHIFKLVIYLTVAASVMVALSTVFRYGPF